MYILTRGGMCIHPEPFGIWRTVHNVRGSVHPVYNYHQNALVMSLLVRKEQIFYSTSLTRKVFVSRSMLVGLARLVG